MFCREIHLINDLKTNIFIEINIISFKDIVVNLITCTTRIESCNIIVSIKIRISNNVIFKSIYFRKFITISLRSKISIKIYYFAILEDRDFLFESNEISHLTSYVYLINVTTKTIILRNNIDRLVYIFRNYYLEKLFKIKYLNAFYINVNNVNEIKELAS
jgi:hypothetical protein